MITITESAQEYLAELLSKQEDALGVRVFINDLGRPVPRRVLPIAGMAISKRVTLSRPLINSRPGFKAEVSRFEDALVDYSPDRMGGQLTIKAPNAIMPRVSDDSPIEDRINYVLYNEVNPSLAAHGGEVSLIEVTEDQFAVLQFGGGCQGCSAVDMTLKGGVEKTLLEQIPQLAGVRDNTDHSTAVRLTIRRAITSLRGRACAGAARVVSPPVQSVALRSSASRCSHQLPRHRIGDPRDPAGSAGCRPQGDFPA